MMAGKGVAGISASGERVSMPEEKNHQKNEQQRAQSGANRKGGTLRRILGAVRTIPDHSGTDKNQNQRPVMAEHGPWVETWNGTVQQNQRPKSNQQYGEHHRTASHSAINRHGTDLSYSIYGERTQN